MTTKAILKALLHLPFQTLQFAIEAKRSQYSSKERLHIFKVMFSLHLKSLFFERKHHVSYQFFGFTFFVQNYLTLLFLFREIFTHAVYAAKITRPHPLILDCGAHAGMASCFFAYKYPSCEVLAFEADPNNFQYLQMNIQKNNLNVKAFNVALSRQVAERVFFLQDQEDTLKSTASSFYDIAANDGNPVKINAQPLSHYLSKDVNPDILKLDVEGAEQEIINDLQANNLLGNCHHIIMEYHYGAPGAKLSTLLQTLEECRFDYRLQSVSYDAFSENSLIIHAYQRSK